MKKFILIYQDHDDFVYSFNTERELDNYVKAYGITDYVVALLYKQV